MTHFPRCSKGIVEAHYPSGEDDVAVLIILNSTDNIWMDHQYFTKPVS